MVQDWDRLEARARAADAEIAAARGHLLAALAVQWRSPAGDAYRRKLEGCLALLDRVPAELDGVLGDVGAGREHSRMLEAERAGSRPGDDALRPGLPHLAEESLRRGGR